jgi:syntaxin 5
MYGQTLNRRTPSPGSQRMQSYSPASSRGGNTGNSILNITQSSQNRNRLLELGNQSDSMAGTSVRVSQQQNMEGAGVRDRTQEFFATVESMLSRSHDSPVDTQRLLRSGPMKKSQFAQEAAQIGKEINQMTVKLGELAKLAKRKGLFDDKSEEINQLMFVIKQDIAKVNQRIAGLSNALVQMKRGASQQLSGKQAEDHASHVVLSLQSKLATTSSQFKDILELRTQNLKESKQRKDQYGVAVPTPMQAGNANQFSTAGLPPPDASSTPVPLNFGQNGLQSQELMQSNTYTDYVSSRAQAIESIESTIAELGQVNSRFRG